VHGTERKQHLFLSTGEQGRARQRAQTLLCDYMFN
jgi:hypothetical protein